MLYKCSAFTIYHENTQTEVHYGYGEEPIENIMASHTLFQSFIIVLFLNGYIQGRIVDGTISRKIKLLINFNLFSERDGFRKKKNPKHINNQMDNTFIIYVYCI